MINILELLTWIYKEFEHEDTFKAVGIFTNTKDKKNDKYIKIWLDDYLIAIYFEENRYSFALVIHPYSIREVTKRVCIETEGELKQKISNLIKNKAY